MNATRFVSRPLPADLDETLRARLLDARLVGPLSPLRVREIASRTAEIVTELGWTVTVFRGGVDLQGTEADHIWLSVSRSDRARSRFVLDAAFPLFADVFVDALRRFVAGDTDRSDLAVAARGTGVRERVLGRFPRGVRYLGTPVWSERPATPSGPSPRPAGRG